MCSVEVWLHRTRLAANADLVQSSYHRNWICFGIWGLRIASVGWGRWVVWRSRLLRWSTCLYSHLPLLPYHLLTPHQQYCWSFPGQTFPCCSYKVEGIQIAREIGLEKYLHCPIVIKIRRELTKVDCFVQTLTILPLEGLHTRLAIYQIHGNSTRISMSFTDLRWCFHWER